MLTYSLNQRGELSLYEHLYRCIRDDIEQGRIAPDEKLPSKRTLARHLGVSLITVEGAYTQLIAEGYVRSEPRRGYYACDLGQKLVHSAPVHHKRNDIAPQSDETVQQTSDNSAPLLYVDNSSKSTSQPASPLIDLSGATIPVGLFPYGAWAKSVREALTCESEQALLGEGQVAGLNHIRETIARYLRGFRGMDVDPRCIVIGAGSQVLYNLLVQLLGREQRYGIEDPGYPRLTSIYRANDVSLAHLPLDTQGVSMAALEQEQVNVVHLMPSHQFPTGLVTSVSRRYELLGWASAKEGRFIIEDDYDCEFRLTGKPIPSLQSIDATGRVIYANTFTKSLGPAFRIGYMVLPESLAQRFQDQLGFYSNTVSAIDQLALARFIDGGDYERHVNRMRTFYRGTRNALLAAFRSSDLAKQCRIGAQDSGIHFVLDAQACIPHDKDADVIAELPPHGHRISNVETARMWSDQVCAEAARLGVRINTIASYYRGVEIPASAYGCFLVSYGGLRRDAIPHVINVLERVLLGAQA